MNSNDWNSRQSGEHPVDRPPAGDAVTAFDVFTMVAVALGVLLAIVYLGGTVE